MVLASMAIGSTPRSGLLLARKSGPNDDGYITDWNGCSELCWLLDLKVGKKIFFARPSNVFPISPALVIVGISEFVDLRIQNYHVAVLVQQLLRQPRSVLVQVLLVLLEFCDLLLISLLAIDVLVLQTFENLDGGNRVVLDLEQLSILLDEFVVIANESFVLDLEIRVVDLHLTVNVFDFRNRARVLVEMELLEKSEKFLNLLETYKQLEDFGFDGFEFFFCPLQQLAEAFLLRPQFFKLETKF